MPDWETREGRLETIEEVEERHGFRHPDDFRAFLAGTSPKTGDTDWLPPFRAEVHGATEDLESIRLFTIKCLPFFLDHQDELFFWHPALLKIAVIVGDRAGSADWVVQITEGAHQGEIYETNHEAFHGLLQGLIETGDARDALVETYGDLQELDADALVELLFDPKVQALHPHLLAESFNALAAGVFAAKGVDLPTVFVG